MIDWHIAKARTASWSSAPPANRRRSIFDEHWLLIKTAVEHVARRVPIVAGTGANSTREAIEHSRLCQKSRRRLSLSVVPYYNKPTQEGLYRHFKAIAEAVDIPQILYNVPGRTVADMQNETVLRLAQIPNIVGIKDATANLERGSDLIRRKPKDFLVFSGDDAHRAAADAAGRRTA